MQLNMVLKSTDMRNNLIFLCVLKREEESSKYAKTKHDIDVTITVYTIIKIQRKKDPAMFM